MSLHNSWENTNWDSERSIFKLITQTYARLLIAAGTQFARRIEQNMQHTCK